ncbi:DUF3800 domain-containing protein [Tianweitania sp. BSSL-BM11]|uniref:DUF3800 domain-containing protein n=1 Tax=Tianweitania aestuarii TaxID=2814886 RepID=A0ABS5RUM7_9HYPH|nr:DUF3800 domain-containing protein [Tianweitania aestuarii]MBS9720032.1 DUF3800 domain-containing protein [Tianweitania aestuarii]
MRYLYVDEAGTSYPEPVSVVACVIVDADAQFVAAEEALKIAFEQVPEEFREGYHFHAKSVWADSKYRTVWQLSDRISFLKEVMSIPRLLKMPVAVGAVRRSCIVPAGIADNKTTVVQFHHTMAFAYCIGRADKYIRDHCPPNEVATIVSEDVPEMRRFLRGALNGLRNSPVTISTKNVRPTAEERKRGIIYQETEQAVTRVRDTVHFASKEDSPLLQLADACAFAFRRALSDQKMGLDFVRSVIGADFPRDDWSGPADASCFYWHPRRFEATAAFAPIWRAK